MNPAIAFEISILLLMIAANGVLAMSEMAVVSASKARLERQAEEGDRRAAAALRLAKDPAHFLAAVQIGITLVGILAGAYGGATLAQQLAPAFSRVPALARYAETISVGLVVAAITYTSLVFGELAPKQYALFNAERIAAAVAAPMYRFSSLVRPLVHLLSFSSSQVLRLLGVRQAAEPEITEEEIKILLEHGAEAGVFEAEEEELVGQVFRLGDQRAGGLMAPRTELVWLDLEDEPEVNRARIQTSKQTYYPVARGGLDNLVGLVLAEELLAQLLEGEGLKMESLLRPPVLVPENMPAFRALAVMKQSHSQIAFVIDEYGGIEGALTASDILEALVGEIPDEAQARDPDIVRREDGSYLLDGMLAADDFKELFKVKALPGEGERLYQTLGGFVMTYLGRVPVSGDHFEWGGLRLEVVDMDGNRVDKVLVALEVGE